MNQRTRSGDAAAYEPIDSALEAELGQLARGRILATERVGDREHPIMINPGIAAMRTFGPVTIPVLGVALSIDATTPAEAEAFVRRFLLGFQRAGA